LDFEAGHVDDQSAPSGAGPTRIRTVDTGYSATAIHQSIVGYSSFLPHARQRHPGDAADTVSRSRDRVSNTSFQGDQEMKAIHKIVTYVAALFLVACSGGDYTPDFSGLPLAPLPPIPPPPPANQAPGGLWYGTLTNDMNVVTEEYFAITADDGRIHLISVDSNVRFHGTVSVAGTDMSGVVRAFADQGVNWLDSNHVVDSSILAVVIERDSFSGTWENVSGEDGTFEFFYDALYEKAADSSLLESVWVGYDDLGNLDVTFTVDANGSFSGQNAQGCTSSGQLTVIDPAYNLYEVQSQIANCAIAGNYSGMAFLGDIFAPNDALVLSIDDGIHTILLALER
jgi:hypothetical protein